MNILLALLYRFKASLYMAKYAFSYQPYIKIRREGILISYKNQNLYRYFPNLRILLYTLTVGKRIITSNNHKYLLSMMKFAWMILHID